MTTRAMTPAGSVGIGSLNSSRMFVLDFIGPVYQARRGFSDKRAMLKAFTAGDDSPRLQREKVTAQIFALVYPTIAPEVQDDDETKGIRVRWIEGTPFRDVPRRLSNQKLFDCGVILAVDALIGHTDRHPGNAMVTANHVIPIDNEHCFERTLRSPGYSTELIGWTSSDTRQNTKSYQSGLRFGLEAIEANAAAIASAINTVADKKVTAQGIIDWVALWRAEYGFDQEGLKAAA